MSESSTVLWVREDGRPGALSLVGELDMAEVPDVRARLAGLAEVNGNVELNCSRLSFIDSSGLYLLVELHRDCEARGVNLFIVDPSACVTRMLELTRLDAVLEIRRNGSAP